MLTGMEALQLVRSSRYFLALLGDQVVGDQVVRRYGRRTIARIRDEINYRQGVSFDWFHMQLVQQALDAAEQHPGSEMERFFGRCISHLTENRPAPQRFSHPIFNRSSHIVALLFLHSVWFSFFSQSQQRFDEFRLFFCCDVEKKWTFDRLAHYQWYLIPIIADYPDPTIWSPIFPPLPKSRLHPRALVDEIMDAWREGLFPHQRLENPRSESEEFQILMLQWIGDCHTSFECRRWRVVLTTSDASDQPPRVTLSHLLRHSARILAIQPTCSLHTTVQMDTYLIDQIQMLRNHIRTSAISP